MSSFPSTAVAAGAAKTKEMTKTITAVAKTTAGAPAAMPTTTTEITKATTAVAAAKATTLVRVVRW